MSLTQERLREVLSYDPATGHFTFRINKRKRLAGARAGCLDKSRGYVVIRVDYKTYLAHRLAWFYVHGVWPPQLTDHIDGDRSNNSLANLRLASPSQNNMNKRRSRNNESGIKGVHFIKKTGRWNAGITRDNRYYFLGNYSTKAEAAEARRAASERMFGEFAVLADIEAVRKALGLPASDRSVDGAAE